jgi:hypothetical protein
VSTNRLTSSLVIMGETVVMGGSPAADPSDLLVHRLWITSIGVERRSGE